MDTLKTVVVIINLIVCLMLILVVVLQSGKSSGLSGALGGGSSETFMSKNRSNSPDAKLARATKWIGGIFVVLTVILNIL